MGHSFDNLTFDFLLNNLSRLQGYFFTCLTSVTIKNNKVAIDNEMGSLLESL